MIPANKTLLSALDASVDHTSAWMSVDHVVALSVQTIMTGSSTGAVKVQASNELNNPTNAVDLASKSVTITTAGTMMIEKFDSSYQWIRLVYTKNNGSAGTISATVNTIGF